MHLVLSNFEHNGHAFSKGQTLCAEDLDLMGPEAVEKLSQAGCIKVGAMEAPAPAKAAPAPELSDNPANEPKEKKKKKA